MTFPSTEGEVDDSVIENLPPSHQALIRISTIEAASTKRLWRSGRLECAVETHARRAAGVGSPANAGHDLGVSSWKYERSN